MTIRKGVVEAVSTKFDKYSVLVDGEWYRTKMEWAKVKPNRGDTIEFDDGGSKFLSKVKIVSAGSGSSGGTAGSAKPDYNLGVELGHASNIALRVINKMIDTGNLEAPVGSTDYYKAFVEQTETVYEIMKGLKNKHSGKPVLKTDTPSAPKTVAEVTDLTEDDLF